SDQVMVHARRLHRVEHFVEVVGITGQKLLAGHRDSGSTHSRAAADQRRSVLLPGSEPVPVSAGLFYWPQRTEVPPTAPAPLPRRERAGITPGPSSRHPHPAGCAPPTRMDG